MEVGGKCHVNLGERFWNITEPLLEIACEYEDHNAGEKSNWGLLFNMHVAEESTQSFGSRLDAAIFAADVSLINRTKGNKSGALCASMSIDFSGVWSRLMRAVE